MLSTIRKALFTDNSSLMVTAVPIFDPSAPSSPASMRASGLVLISPNRTIAGQELYSCVVAILASILPWEPSRQTVAGMELKYAFGKLGITDDSVLMAFSEPSFYRPDLPLDEDSLKHVDPDTELLETSFNPYTIVGCKGRHRMFPQPHHDV